jgi:RimJ/RimL family protein N-acetyltransferase
MIRAADFVLRRPERRDAAAIAVALGDNRVARMLARVPQPYDLKDAEEWLASLDANPNDLVFAVAIDGRLAGIVAVEDRAGAMTLGYWLARRHWGGGLATRAVRECLMAHFGAGGGGDVASGVFADNPASLRVQEKLGFTVTGRGELFSLARNRMVTEIRTSLTREAFEDRQRRDSL